jgi:transposase InsO family protein
LGVSQAWYYKWRHGDVSLRRKRRAAVDAAVAYEFARRHGRDGSPPITTRLRDQGWRISKNTVADSMRCQGLVARRRRGRHGLTKADRRARKPADLLKRDFAPPAGINRRWVSDLTEIPTDEGPLYLASILDLHSRRRVGSAMGVHHDADLAAAAVCTAIAVRGGNVAGVVLHTDQGGEFSGGELTRVCDAAGIVQSMGRTGSALDNAVAESFHSTIEFEVLSRTRFATREQARRVMATWLGEYDTIRLHSTNGMIAPVDYENGWRRPGAKTYAQLRRRHSNRTTDKGKDPTEAATPPLPTPLEPLRDGHRRRTASGPVPPTSRAADAVADATACPPTATAAVWPTALDLGASTGPGRRHQRQATACRSAHAAQPDQDP